MEQLFTGNGYEVFLQFVEQIHLFARGTLIHKYKDFLDGKKLVEFGVCHGGSMRSFINIYNQLKIPIDFWGFDSFEGIPTEHSDINNIWEVGEFSRNGAPPVDLINHAGVNLVKGWFEETLNNDSARAINQQSVGIAHFDCDTYSSTMTSWRWLLQNKLVTPGTIVIYDDWGAFNVKKCGEFEIGEAMAHIDIQKEYKIRFEDLGRYCIHPDFYIVKIFRILQCLDTPPPSPRSDAGKIITF